MRLPCGDTVLPLHVSGGETSVGGVQSLYASATHDDQAGEIIVKAVNPGAAAAVAEIKLAGLSQIEAEGKAIVLAGESLNGVNTMTKPTAIAPVESTLENAAADFTYNFAPHSLTVLRIKAR